MAPRLSIEIAVFSNRKSVFMTENAKSWIERAVNNVLFNSNRFSLLFLRLQEPKEIIFS